MEFDAPVRRNRHEQRKAITREGLLQAAREVIVEKGYDDVDILDITERADVAKTTFYQHFANKEECAHQLMLQGFDTLVQRIISEEKAAESRSEWILSSYRNLFEWAEANSQFLSIMLGGAASHRLNVLGRTYMADIIERLMRQIGLSEETSRYPLPLIAQVVTGILIQLLGWRLSDSTSYSADDMARIVDDIVTHGIGPLAL